MSQEMRWFVGGQQALMPELLAMVASTVNSYSRLVPGFWAPTSATWGVENRTCALRVIQGGPKAQRVEYRIAAADINPYLALAVAIGSGLWGIEHRIEPDEPISGNAYERKLPAKRQLPRTLNEAAGRLAHSKAARELFGEPFVAHYRRQPRMGGARVPARRHRLGAGALFRDHLMSIKSISPIDGSVYGRARARHAGADRGGPAARARRAGAVARGAPHRARRDHRALLRASSSGAAPRSPAASPGRSADRSALPRARCAARSSAPAT